jgi:cell division protein FtsI (penicillin-binding protein 3)
LSKKEEKREGKMSVKQVIVARLIGIYLGALLFALVIIARILQLQFVKGDELRQKAQELTMKYESIEPNRGDIYSNDGRRLLSTSVPFYEIRMDLLSNALEERVFNKGIDSLAYCLAKMFRDKPASQYKRELITARSRGQRYHLINRQVSHQQLLEMKTFPVFRLGRYKGGFIVIQKNRRIHPHQMLAARTIGYLNEGESGNVVGIEGAYDHYLSGITGIRLMQKTAGNVWIPVSDKNEVEPKDGYDVISTIDIDLQDVAENALLDQLKKHQAHHGCAVVMEVKTGEVKAIVNLQRDGQGNWGEIYNYAIAESTEPGSTFKLISLIAALEDGYIELDDTVDTGKGSVRYYDKVVRDTKEGGYGKISVQNAFEVSSNVGISKIIYSHYKGREVEFVDRLYRMHLNEPLGIDIKGEGIPHIQYPGDKYWSGISLPMMSHGYEVRLTPLQVLTFYNAIANNGTMIKPKFVKRITSYGRIIKTFPTEVIDPSICSRETLKKAKIMLEGVVERGTAMNLKNETYKIAGKTGTAQIANEKYGYKVNSQVSYQASFVGYFPAENPKYSCIVVINSPSSVVYYGNLVAGPVFREIANKVYATSLDMQEAVNHDKNDLTEIPYSKNGDRNDLDIALDYLDIPSVPEAIESNWVATIKEEDHIDINDLRFGGGLVPNVKEMGLKDALYLLESKGLIVDVRGEGKVLEQSLQAGSVIRKGDRIVLTMSQ